jgi:adenosylcobyric acid synthase
MNPVLLKPGSDHRSHVVVRGRPAGTLEASSFLDGRAALASAALSAYDELAARYDVVVCEGAGSPAEVNLRAHDFVNMGLARHGGIPTLLVGDIDRGGVFAAMHGTLALLDAGDQALVAGLVVNKFRGDLGLLRPGLTTLEQVTGRPVLGVVPWLPDLWLDSEDSLALRDRVRDHGGGTDPLRVAVVVPPRVSNFTDVDALCLEPGVRVSFVDHPRDLASADVVVLPGSRATLADLAWLRASGLADAVRTHVGRGGVELGVCGGLQMLGAELRDPDGVAAEPGSAADGLGLLDVRTRFGAGKQLGLPRGEELGVPVGGYEIHHGRVEVGGDEPFAGGARRGGVFGTMWHGTLEDDAFRSAWLHEVGRLLGREVAGTGEVSFPAAREARLETLADALEEHLDLETVLRLVEDGPPAGLVPVRGGLVR